MSVITNKALLNAGTEVIINNADRTWRLVVTGNLTTDGVDFNTMVSWAIDYWKNTTGQTAYPFPFNDITKNQFEVGKDASKYNGWAFYDDTTRGLLRNAGWREYSAAGALVQEWANITSLGSIGATDQVYYQQTSGGSVTNFILPGPVNQAIKIYGDATHGNFTRRNYFKMFVREYQKTYSMAQLSDRGITNLSYDSTGFGLQNTADNLKITHSDATVNTTAPYTSMSIKWEASPVSRSMSGGSYPFSITIDAAGGTVEQVYEFVQRQLRKSTDIDGNGGGHIGNVTNPLGYFVGNDFYSYPGVFINNIVASDKNKLYLADDNFVEGVGTRRTFPYTAAMTFSVSDTLSNDPTAVLHVYFEDDSAATSPLGYNYGTTNAITAKDAAGTDMVFSLYGQTSITVSFDYDGNVQRGAGSGGKDAWLIGYATGTTGAKPTLGRGLMGRSTANNMALVAPQAYNYIA